MGERSLVRELERLRRSVVMLQTEFRREHMDEGLIAEIEQQMDHGIAIDARCSGLVALVDALRETTLTPRAELHRDAARACERLKDAIEEVVSGVRS
ncbi:MAG: hypothetical protein KDC00_08335 [Flavobacteriales bacterium]|nr:hypothetical protein [Flavobacteriales bacterium]